MSDKQGKSLAKKALPTRFLMLAAAWEDLAKKSPGSDDFTAELATVMVIAATLKDVCVGAGLTQLAEGLEEVEGMLADTADLPAGVKEDFQLLASKISHLVVMSEEAAGIKEEIGKRRLATPTATLEQTPIEVDEPIFVSGEGKARNVFIMSADESFVSECSVQMGHYGYTSHSFHTTEAFERGLEMAEPIALIVDLDLLEGEGEEVEKSLASLMRKASERAHSPLPMMVVSSHGDFYARLKAVRCGCAAFFSKPVNVSLLLDKLDAVISNAYVSEPFRILVVDDSETMIRFIQRTLQNANMKVHVETQADRVLAAVAEFHPDLILTDMYMPFCDGQDLSRIIRQYESYTSLPIVFLSSETDIKKQMAAMQIGADDFLTKPVDPDHLIASITTRVQRHRVLSSFMVRDSLTGLLNHTKLKQHLEQTIQKAHRSKLDIAFAMIDIDHFKSVNDTYGHPTGDRVIKSLSRLLQRRLRKTDAIGRYGGEEFAVILWETDAQMAARLIDKIRDDFSKIEQRHEGKKFSCTFSAGVASFPVYLDAQSISSAADKALYVAKHSGRNQVMIAKEED